MKTNPEAETEAELTETVGPKMGRRRFIATTAGAATAATVGSAYAVRNAQAIAPALLAGAAIGTGVGVAVGYATRRMQEFLTGDEPDYARYAELDATHTHEQFFEDALSMYAYDDSALTNLSNVIDLSPNAAYSDAQAAAVESMDLGNTETDVIATAKAEIDEHYTVQQMNLFDHWQIQIGKHKRWADEIEATTNLGRGDVARTVRQDDIAYEMMFPSGAFAEESATLLDGTLYAYEAGVVATASGDVIISPTGTAGGVAYTRTEVSTVWAKPTGTGANEIYFECARYYDLLQEIESQATTAKTEIETWVNGVYPNYQAGDIDLADLVTGTQFADAAAIEDGYAHATADLGLLGMPLPNATMTIELPQSDAVVDGTISARNQPDGGFVVGGQYDPANISGPVWMAYNYTVETTDADGNLVEETRSDLVELQEPFIITDARAADGTSLDVVNMRSRNQRTLETDVAALNKELDQLRELQLELEDLKAQAAGGGAGGSGQGIAAWARDNPGQAAVGGGIGALLLRHLFGSP